MKRLRAVWKKLRRSVFRPYAKMLCMRLIIFYQRYFSKGTCLYRQVQLEKYR